MEEPNTNFQRQPETKVAATKKRVKVFRWAVIKSHKILIIVFLVISAGMALSILILLEPCRGGLGCAVLISFYIASFPILPIMWMVGFILDKITHSYGSFYGTASILKFFPAIILSTAAFFLGYLATHLFLRLGRAKIGVEKYIEDVRLARKNFTFYNLIFIIVFSGYIFIQAPPAPLASNPTVVKSCLLYEEQCYRNYVHSKLKTCEGDKTMFVYPLKTTFPPIDQCMFDSFGESKLFEDITISHNSRGAKIITSEEQGITYLRTSHQMDILFNMFMSQLASANVAQKKSFCTAFSDEIKTGYAAGNISNKEYCIQRFGFLPDDESNLANLCLFALTRESWTQSDLQRKCVSRFADFQTYDPDPSIYDEFFGSGWEYINLQPNDAKYENLSKKLEEFNDGTTNVVYRLIVEIRSWGQLRISQVSIDSPTYNDFLDLDVTQKEIGNTQSWPEERIGVTEETILGNRVLIEHRLVRRRVGLGDRFYNIFHFVKNRTYIQINSDLMPRFDAEKTDLMFRKITEDILGRTL